MTPFILFSLLLLILALLFIVVPLWRFRPLEKSEDGEIRRQKNTEIYELGLSELEKDRQEALLQEEDYDRLKTELQRSFLRDMEDEDYRLQGNTAVPKKLVPLLGLLFVPVFSYAVYEMIGSARDLELPEILEALSAAETAEAQEELFVNLADFLQSRLDRREDDIQNGYMLGTLYIELEQFDADAVAGDEVGELHAFEAFTENIGDNLGEITTVIFGRYRRHKDSAAERVLIPFYRRIDIGDGDANVIHRVWIDHGILSLLSLLCHDPPPLKSGARFCKKASTASWWSSPDARTP